MFKKSTNMTNLSRAYKGCSNLTNIKNLGQWDMSKTTDVSEMFNGCGKLNASFTKQNEYRIVGSFNYVTIPNSSNLSYKDIYFIADGDSNIYRFGSDMSCNSPYMLSTFKNSSTEDLQIGSQMGMSGGGVNNPEFGSGTLYVNQTAEMGLWDTSSITNMRATYYNCSNLTGQPICGPKVTDMTGTYWCCTNLTGKPVCASNVTNMASTYFYCKNLTGSPVCGGNVTNMYMAYSDCINLTGSPVCSNNVTDMGYAYSNCSNLTGSPVCGNNVKIMDSTYNNCTNLTGCAIAGNNVTHVPCAYRYCHNIKSNAYFYSNNISYAYSCFAGKQNSKRLNIYVPENSTTLNTFLYNNTSSILGANVTWIYDESGCYYNGTYSTYIYPVTNVYQAYKQFDAVLFTLLTYTTNNTSKRPVTTGLSDDYTATVNGSQVTYSDMSTDGIHFNFYNDKNITAINYMSDELTNMFNTFYNCTSLTVPVCGEGIVNMRNAYYNCYGLKGNAICGSNVVDMCQAYYMCTGLTTPVCGPNVVDMGKTYFQCYNLTGNAVCGPNVTNMYQTYQACRNLTGNPACGDNVTIMYNTYCMCYNMKGNPVCGPNVTSMSGAYRDCSNLTGSPVCGDNVTNMGHAYYNCRAITGNAVCGPNVTNMQYAYWDCRNLNGAAACGDKVETMAFAYNNCQKLIGPSACGNNVTNMSQTYYQCINLKGSPVCGNKVTNMGSTYFNCKNITGSPACGDSVTYMYNAYHNCTNLTGSPACGNNVVYMSYAYNNCQKLTGAPVCGNKVYDMTNTYYYCVNLTGQPVCGPNVNYLTNTYFFCNHLTGSPVCGNNVTDMAGAYYNCSSLTGSPVVGPNVTNMFNTYTKCSKLTGRAVCGSKVTSMNNTYNACNNITTGVIGPNVTDSRHCYNNCYRMTSVELSNGLTKIGDCAFYNCTNLTNVVFPSSVTNIGYDAFYNCTKVTSYDFRNHTSIPSIYNNTFNGINANCTITVPTELLSDWSTTGYWSTYQSYIIPSSTEPMVIDKDIPDSFKLGPGKTKTLSFKALNVDFSTVDITITSTNAAIARSATSHTVVSQGITNTVTFEITAYELGETTINITAYSGVNGFHYTKDIAVTVAEILEPVITVEPVTGASYGFALNANGYYESQNKGQHGTAALCKVTIENPGNHQIIFDCINYGESSYDFGILSNVGATLSTSNTADTSGVFKSFKGQQSANVVSVKYGAVNGTIYVKYRKDGSDSSGNDTLQFKVRFEDPIELGDGIYTVEPVDGAGYGFAFNANGFYESQNKGQKNSAALCKVTIDNPDGNEVVFECINSGEANYDYGLLSVVGATLSTNYSADTSSLLFKNFYGLSSTAIQTVSYGNITSGTIYVKFIKDSSSDVDNDSLQFRVIFKK